MRLDLWSIDVAKLNTFIDLIDSKSNEVPGNPVCKYFCAK